MLSVGTRGPAGLDRAVFGFSDCCHLLDGDDFAVLAMDGVDGRGLGVRLAEHDYARPAGAHDRVIGQKTEDVAHGAIVVGKRGVQQRIHLAAVGKENDPLPAVDNLQRVRSANNCGVAGGREVEGFGHIQVASASSNHHRGRVLGQKVAQSAHLLEPLGRHSRVWVREFVTVGDHENMCCSQFLPPSGWGVVVVFELL